MSQPQPKPQACPDVCGFCQSPGQSSKPRNLLRPTNTKRRHVCDNCHEHLQSMDWCMSRFGCNKFRVLAQDSWNCVECVLKGDPSKEDEFLEYESGLD